MFDHNKGPISNVRHDLYLYGKNQLLPIVPPPKDYPSGSSTVLRFRSPAEFIPHGIWLLTDPTLNNNNCGCKYCGGGRRTQSEISQALGLPTTRGAGARGSSTRIRIGLQRPSHSTTNQSIRALPEDTPWVPAALRLERTTDPAWRTMSLKQKLAVNTSRISDLRSARRFRVGELVWCAWDGQTGNNSSSDGVSPPFWPAIVLERSLESVIDPECSSGNPYTIIQKRHYSLRRLGAPSAEMRMQFECILDENAILPWQAYREERGLLSAPGEVIDHSSGCASHFILALRIAKRLAETWAVCGRFPVKLPSASVSQPYPLLKENCTSDSHAHEGFLTPDRHIDAAPALSVLHPTDNPPRRSPARLKPISLTKRTMRVDDIFAAQEPAGARDGLTPQELPQNSQSCGVSPRIGGVVTQTQYEALWYGAERIWIGDVVRLCPEREAFASSLRLTYMARKNEGWQYKASPSPGAVMRGVLMRVERIFARVGDRGSKECAIAGPLYEVASEEWTEAVVLPGEDSPSGPPVLSSPSHPDHVYYPWDMPQSPPSRPGRNTSVGCSIRPASYPLPSPPPGYKLRPLLPPESEIALPVHFIAGRYYPDILQWSFLAPVIPELPEDISSVSLAAAAETRGVNLLSLCGLAPGRFSRAVCVDIQLASRTRMINESALRVASQDKDLDSMDVDGP